MARRPDRPTYLESLDDERRATLLDMANLLRQDRSRLHSLRAARSSSNEQPVKIVRPLDSTSLYMKSIWQLRHQLNSLTIDHDATKQQLMESEKRCHDLESELQNTRYQYNVHMSTMAEQIEELICRSDLAARSAHQALERQQRSDADRSETESKLSTLRSLLASDFSRSESVQVAEDTRRHTKLLEKLITPQMMEASQPPDDFASTAARSFTVQEFRLMEATVKQSIAESSHLKNQLDALNSKYEKSQTENHEKMKLSEQQKAKLNQSLTGAARRIQWLVGEKQKMVKNFQSLNEYSTKLENKLLKQYEELQRLKGSKPGAKKSKATTNSKNSSNKTEHPKQQTELAQEISVMQGSEFQPIPEPPIKENIGMESRPSGILHLVKDKEHQKQVDFADDKQSLFGNVPLRIQFGLNRFSDLCDDRPSLSELVKSAIEKEGDSDR